MKETLRHLFSETLAETSLERVMAAKTARRGNALAVDDLEIDLAEPERIFVASIGKAARPMAAALAALLPAAKTSGAVVAPDLAGGLPGGFRGFAGGHPYPNGQSVAAAEFLLDRLAALGRRDLAIFLLSGGGSAICEAPLEAGVALDDLRAFYEVLVTCGGNIVDMNVLRKHLSRVKGGRLAEAAAPAHQLTLYVSDVPPGEPSTVASGPTMPDESTCEDAYETARRLGAARRAPDSIRRLFENRALQETPKPGAAAFACSQWSCLLDNAAALESLEAKARKLGWLVERDLSVDDEPVEKAADALLDRLRELAKAHPGQTVAVTTGGELSSPVTGDGKGGRNQAFALWVARKLAARGQRATVLSAGTDGIDGNSPAAGAVADETTLSRAEALGLDAADFERRSDAYSFFERLDDLIVTGPTGNNVRDLRLLAAEPER